MGAALRQAEEEAFDFSLEADNFEQYLGKPFFNTEKLYNHDIPVVALGLAYTSLGGHTGNLLPVDNRKDFEELDGHIKEGLTVHYADYFDDVLKYSSLESA